MTLDLSRPLKVPDQLFLKKYLNHHFKAVRRHSVVEKMGHPAELEVDDHCEEDQGRDERGAIVDDSTVQPPNDPLLTLNFL